MVGFQYFSGRPHPELVLEWNELGELSHASKHKSRKAFRGGHDGG